MKPSRLELIRFAILFWIVVPIFATIIVVAFVEAAGRFFLDSDVVAGSAYGIVFLASFIPIIAAHLAFFAAVAGVITLFASLRSDRRLLIAILVGLAFGGFMLHGIYVT